MSYLPQRLFNFSVIKYSPVLISKVLTFHITSVILFISKQVIKETQKKIQGNKIHMTPGRGGVGIATDRRLISLSFDAVHSSTTKGGKKLFPIK